MALLFWSRTVDMFMSVGIRAASEVGLSFQVHLISEQDIELTSEENFDDLDGRIAVLPEIETTEDRGNGIGTMSYFGSMKTDFDTFPSKYIVDVCVPKPQFDQLVAAAHAGRIPSNISIYVDEIEIGWAPDGSVMKWDNRKSPKLKVTAVEFTIPLFHPSDTHAGLP